MIGSFNERKENMTNQIEKLFETELKPGIANELKTRDEIIKQIEKIEADSQTFQQRGLEAVAEIERLEMAVDERITSRKPADDLLQKLTTKRAEKDAYERQNRRLADQGIEAAACLKNANAALTEAMCARLDTMRAAVEKMISGQLENVLEGLISFEINSREAEKACGVEIGPDKTTMLFRFPNMFDQFHDLGAYLEPCGADVSAIRRRELLAQWAEKKALSEPADNKQ